MKVYILKQDFLVKEDGNWETISTEIKSVYADPDVAIAKAHSYITGTQERMGGETRLGFADEERVYDEKLITDANDMYRVQVLAKELK